MKASHDSRGSVSQESSGRVRGPRVRVEGDDPVDQRGLGDVRDDLAADLLQRIKEWAPVAFKHWVIEPHLAAA